MFAPKHVVKHEGQSTKKFMRKDTKSLVVKKKLDEEREKLTDMAREQKQKHETQANRKKKYPVETRRRKKVDQRSTPKEQTLNKAEGQHKMRKADEGVQNKNEETEKAEKRNQSPEVDQNPEVDQKIKEDMAAGPGPNLGA